MTFDEWKEIGLFPRAYRPWLEGKLNKIEVIPSTNGTWVAVAGKVRLGRGKKSAITTAALIAKLERPVERRQ